ncbi:MAG: hypothetical protein ACI4F1_02300 [Bariatricus sp.]
MGEFVKCINEAIEEAYERFQGAIREAKEEAEEAGYYGDSLDLHIDSAESQFRSELGDLLYLCMDHNLPENEIDKLFSAWKEDGYIC